MECTLATLIACFSWSGFYVDTSLSYLDSGIAIHEIKTNEVYTWAANAPAPVYVRLESQDLYHSTDNPYGQVAIGYQLDLGSTSWSLELGHISSLSTSKDRGRNSINLRMRWHPFQR